jgi:amino acid adenylation domain-containing protein
LLVEWNQTEADYPRDKCVHQLFEAQAERTPDAIAVVFEDQQLTYRELNERSNQLAHHLRKLGIGPDVLVGLCVERSLEMLVGLLGILKAGGAYVPLDPTYPKDRVRFVLADTQTPMLITQQRLCVDLGSETRDCTFICLDADFETIAKAATENPKSGVGPGNLAYVIYTSGSTGKPKGVAIEHHSSVMLVNWAHEVFSARECAGVLFSTSICFDLSVFEVFVPLSRGGKIILADNALQLPTLPAAKDVTLVNTVPSAIKELVRLQALPSSVCTVNLAGEPLGVDLVKEIYQLPGVVKVYDLYGPSETTTYSTWSLRSADGPYTIGRPIANTQIYILDANGNPVPIGVPGELHIGGEGVARGYLNRPELTKERFIADPFSSRLGRRLYKTGDLARYFPDGNIELLGRLDHQVKIRGFRIEMGEIETVLKLHPSVREAVVVAREDAPGDRRLVAYVAPAGASVPAGELGEFLKARLPAYMLPSAFVFIDVFPLTPNGKLDRRALPAPEGRSVPHDSYLAPRTPTEEAMASIWCEVLNLKQVGIHDNFFALGGHSLLATRMISRVRNVFQLGITLGAFFEAPTIASLAEKIENVLWVGKGRKQGASSLVGEAVEGRL